MKRELVEQLLREFKHLRGFVADMKLPSGEPFFMASPSADAIVAAAEAALAEPVQGEPTPVAADALAPSPSVIARLMRDPCFLRLLMIHEDTAYTEAEAMADGDNFPTWPTARYSALRERGRSIMAEDLDVWTNSLRVDFGFPPYAPPTDTATGKDAK